MAYEKVIVVSDLENPPTEDETTKAPTSEWAFDHNARDATAAQQGHATAAQITKLDGIETGEDVTDFFDKYRDLVSWSSLDGYTTTTTGGSSGVQGALLFLLTGATNGNSTTIIPTNTYQSIVQTGKVITVEWVIMYVSSVTSVVRRVYISQSNANPASDTVHHFGFKVTNGDIYSSSSDGSVEEANDTTSNLATGIQITRLKAVLTPGTDCKFYVDGVLKATHSTRLPQVGSYWNSIGLTTSENVAKDMYLGRFALEREY